MITIQSAMLVALGFFVATLLGFLAAPLYRRRAARLATDALKATMPLTSAEIAADKDRLRAQYALTIHRLEKKVEEASHASAKQQVEINRREAGISALEGEVQRLRTSLEEHENARRVLEQTITERLPKVEARLAEAKKLLFQRDREIATLTQTSAKQGQALEEATQINVQQRDEIHRLNATISTRAARNRETVADPRFDGEVALRSEIEGLRAKTREQAGIINRLQSMMAGVGSGVGSGVGPSAGSNMGSGADSDAERRTPSASQVALIRPIDASTPSDGSDDAGAEIQRLRKDLAEAELALRSARGLAEQGSAGQAALENEIRSARAVNEDLSAEIARLKAALKAYEEEDTDDRALKESKIAMRARLSALKAQSDEQATTIKRLRSEAAAANEKLARQAAHFMDEMRRVGIGMRSPAAQPANGDAERAVRQPLVERINAPRPPRPVAESAEPEAAPATAEDAKPERRTSLIERITRAEKPVA